MTELDIKGMTCDHCVHTVTEALRQVGGVTEARVTLKTGKAQVDGSASAADLIAAVAEEGYGAKLAEPVA
jgi:copper chaperone